MFDAVVIGAGFAGAVFARELASVGKRVLLIEKRNHIGGNCYDYFDEHGILIHKYGPHLLHTSNSEVFHYLSRFTRWREYQHRVLAEVDGKQVPIPFNLNSIEMLFPAEMAARISGKLIDRFGFGSKAPILELLKTEDDDLHFLADFIYEKIFLNYTLKQWGCHPEEISSEVMSRVPVLVSRDDRYFQDRFQVMPEGGYTKLFSRLLDHAGIHLLLNTNYRDVLDFNSANGTMTLFGQPFTKKLVFTGMIDELLDFRFGELPYRALNFSFTNINKDYYQDVTVVNYPNMYQFTRITEFKHLTGQDIPGHTVILREFPEPFERNKSTSIPCYPVLQAEGVTRYKQYKEHADRFANLLLVGRLAEYRYYDMDDIVDRALTAAVELMNCE